MTLHYTQRDIGGRAEAIQAITDTIMLSMVPNDQHPTVGILGKNAEGLTPNDANGDIAERLEEIRC